MTFIEFLKFIATLPLETFKYFCEKNRRYFLATALILTLFLILDNYIIISILSMLIIFAFSVYPQIYNQIINEPMLKEQKNLIQRYETLQEKTEYDNEFNFLNQLYKMGIQRFTLNKLLELNFNMEKNQKEILNNLIKLNFIDSTFRQYCIVNTIWNKIEKTEAYNKRLDQG